jgi:putative endonuclease
MYYAYVLHSEKDGNFYYGSTENIERRIQQHNFGMVESTKCRRPLNAVGYIKYKTRKEAESQERLFKKSRNKNYALKLLNKYGAIV